MANAQGSSAGAEGHGDLARAISHKQHCQAFMASTRWAAPVARNVHHQQYFDQSPAGGLIPAAPVAMPVHVPVSSEIPYTTQIAVPPPLIPPPDHRHSLHSVTPTGACFSNSFKMAPTVLPTSPFQLMFPSSTNYTSNQIFEETNNLKDTSRVFGGWDNERNYSEDQDSTPVVEMEDLNQGNGHINVTNKIMPIRYIQKASCQEYHMVLRKDLTNSDVRNNGRSGIVRPKKDAERNLPILEDKVGVILEMDDFELPAVWKFKYRYRTSNSSRTYILETTSIGFKLRTSSSFTGSRNMADMYITLKSENSLRFGMGGVLASFHCMGYYVVRALKAEDITTPKCECIKAGSPRENCGFFVSAWIK